MKCLSFLHRFAVLRTGAAAFGATCAMATILLAGGQIAAAGACGDDVDGARVACACGDNVVTDTVLWPTDPVVSEPCSGDGLILLAPSQSDGITLNLGGQSIVGTGSGAGIRVARGGRLGSTIVGGDAEDARAEIARFRTGIRASGRNILREVRALDLHDHGDDGLNIRSSGVRIEDVRSQGNGRNGLALSGHGIEVSGVVSEHNVRDGLQVRGTGAKIDAETNSNRRNGTVIAGRGNKVEAVSTNNGASGLLATGSGHDVAGLNTSGNDGGDISGRAGAMK